MNASELADKLSDKTMRDYIVFEYLPEIVSMLRKQQESIEGLNRDYDLLFAEHQLLLKKEWVEITDEEILEVWKENEKVYPMDRSRLLDRTRACIRKAQNK